MKNEKEVSKLRAFWSDSVARVAGFVATHPTETRVALVVLMLLASSVVPVLAESDKKDLTGP
jgi:hypothetical protein